MRVPGVSRIIEWQARGTQAFRNLRSIEMRVASALERAPGFMLPPGMTPGEFPHLRALAIDGLAYCSADAARAVLRGLSLTALTALDLTCAWPFDADDVTHLRCLEHLRVGQRYLGGVAYEFGCAPLTSLTCLRSLHLDDVGSVARLGALTRLTQL